MTNSSHRVPGFDAVGIAAGIKGGGALDLALVTSPTPCRAAAVFTQNAFPAAPVTYDQQVLSLNAEGIYGVVINSGCANACTGVVGSANARFTAEAVERVLDAADGTILVMSTGVIGVQLPMETLTDAIPRAVDQLQPDGWLDAATAIMTTDTRPKLSTRRFLLDGVELTITGMAKGAGMLHPNMATMLSVVVTDAVITQKALQTALHQATQASFNRISVDGDTSTNDTLLVLANGAAGHQEIESDSAALAAFTNTLTELCVELAQELVRDGEGATKFVTVQINGAEDDAAAHQAANTIATSPLVKTAFFGSDANWGRLLAALGRAGIQVDPNRCDLFIAGGAAESERGPALQLVAGGMPTAYQEVDAARIFGQPEIDVRIELGIGPGTATVWTSDLSHDYVTINGDYRT